MALQSGIRKIYPRIQAHTCKCRRNLQSDVGVTRLDSKESGDVDANPNRLAYRVEEYDPPSLVSTLKSVGRQTIVWPEIAGEIWNVAARGVGISIRPHSFE